MSIRNTAMKLGNIHSFQALKSKNKKFWELEKVFLSFIRPNFTTYFVLLLIYDILHYIFILFLWHKSIFYPNDKNTDCA